LEGPKLGAGEKESPVSDDYRHRERAAGQALALGAVACVDQPWCFGDLVTNLAALAAAGLWELHRVTPSFLAPYGLIVSALPSQSLLVWL